MKIKFIQPDFGYKLCVNCVNVCRINWIEDCYLRKNSCAIRYEIKQTYEALHRSSLGRKID